MLPLLPPGFHQGVKEDETVKSREPAPKTKPQRQTYQEQRFKDGREDPPQGKIESSSFQRIFPGRHHSLPKLFSQTKALDCPPPLI